MSPKHEYDKPAVTADCVILCRRSTDSKKDPAGATTSNQRPSPGAAYEVLLIQRAREPFACRWALPGGFVNKDEPLLDAARRELREETGLHVSELQQVGAFGAPGRDPRGWTISVAYVGVVGESERSVGGSDDARDARWFPLHDLPPLAFDHAEIISAALRVKGVTG